MISSDRFFTCELSGDVFVLIPFDYDDRPGIVVSGATLRPRGTSIPWAAIGHPPRLSAADVLPGDAVEFQLHHEFPLDGFKDQSWYGVVLEKGVYVATLERCPDAATAIRRSVEVKREGQLGR